MHQSELRTNPDGHCGWRRRLCCARHRATRLPPRRRMKIKTILTDNGCQFTDRFTSATRSPSGQHVFDLTCRSIEIEYRLCPPRHPQTNGMVGRFNGRISDIVDQTRFMSATEMDDTLRHHLSTYNHLIAQRALTHQTPIRALQKWRAEKPELFVKWVYKQTGLDTTPSTQPRWPQPLPWPSSPTPDRPPPAPSTAPVVADPCPLRHLRRCNGCKVRSFRVGREDGVRGTLTRRHHRIQARPCV